MLILTLSTSVQTASALIFSPVIHMSDTTASYGVLVNSQSQVFAGEWVRSTSQLIGDKIDSITLRLQKVGTPSGTFTVGVYNSAMQLKQSFGVVTISSLSTTMTDRTFTITSLYTIAADDRIGIFYNGSNGGINVMMDKVTTDSMFDGQNTQRIRGLPGGGWNALDTNEDTYMILKQTHGGEQYPLVHMSDTTTSFASLISAPRSLIAEYVSSTSQLVGDPIDSITLKLQRVNFPAGNAQVGIFDANLGVKRLFGTVDAATLSTMPADYEFKLPTSEQPYIIAAGDRIGLKYVYGSGTAGINVTPDRDVSDPFDGTNSYRTRFEEGRWITSTGEDLYMVLKQTRAVASSPIPTGITITGEVSNCLPTIKEAFEQLQTVSMSVATTYDSQTGTWNYVVMTDAAWVDGLTDTINCDAPPTANNPFKGWMYTNQEAPKTIHVSSLAYSGDNGSDTHLNHIKDFASALTHEARHEEQMKTWPNFQNTDRHTVEWDAMIVEAGVKKALAWTNGESIQGSYETFLHYRYYCTVYHQVMPLAMQERFGFTVHIYTDASGIHCNPNDWVDPSL